jgi:hypothetical protein
MRGIESLYQIDRLLGAETETLALGVSGAVDQLCVKFHLIKPYIEPALVFVKLLPKGKQIAQVVEFLTDIANRLCPAPGATAAAAAVRAPTRAPLADAPPFGDVEAAFGKLSAALSTPGTRQVAAAAVDPCQLYRDNKKWIATILSFVEWLPSGGTVAKVIRLLMQIADGLCRA